MRSALHIAVMALPVVVFGGALLRPLPVSAQATNFRQEYEDLKNSIPGLGTERAPIDFTERAPLVVPPTNDLPPPQETSQRLGVNDPDRIERRKALSDPRRPVPLTDPGATATGLSARAFLIQPPSGLQDPAAVAGEAKADGFKDKPKRKKGSGGGHIVKHQRRTPAPAVATATQ